MQQSGFCLSGLLQSQLLRHGDVSVEMLRLLDAVQTLPAELRGRDSSLPEGRRHLENNEATAAGCWVTRETLFTANSLTSYRRKRVGGRDNIMSLINSDSESSTTPGP